MELGLLGYPGGFYERCDQLTCSGNESRGIPNAVTAIIPCPSELPSGLTLQRARTANGSGVSVSRDAARVAVTEGRRRLAGNRNCRGPANEELAETLD